MRRFDWDGFFRAWAFGTAVGLLLAALFLASRAHAQADKCSNLQCKVVNLITTGAPRNGNSTVGGSGAVRVGSHSTANGGAIWLGIPTDIPTSSNYSMLGNTSSTYLNGGQIFFENAGVTTMGTWNGTLLTLNAGYERIVGVASASLPTCNGGAAGSLHYDTTNTCITRCDGTTWNCLAGTGGTNPAVTSAGATWAGDVSATAYPVNTGWSAMTPFVAGTTQKLTYVQEIAGVGAGTILATIFDVTGAANVCTLTITCNSAVGTRVGPTTCGPASLAASRTYDMRWTTDGCTTRPAGDLVLTYTTP